MAHIREVIYDALVQLQRSSSPGASDAAYDVVRLLHATTVAVVRAKRDKSLLCHVCRKAPATLQCAQCRHHFAVCSLQCAESDWKQRNVHHTGHIDMTTSCTQFGVRIEDSDTGNVLYDDDAMDIDADDEDDPPATIFVRAMPRAAGVDAFRGLLEQAVSAGVRHMTEETQARVDSLVDQKVVARWKKALADGSDDEEDEDEGDEAIDWITVDVDWATVRPTKRARRQERDDQAPPPPPITILDLPRDMIRLILEFLVNDRTPTLKYNTTVPSHFASIWAFTRTCKAFHAPGVVPTGTPTTHVLTMFDDACTVGSVEAVRWIFETPEWSNVVLKYRTMDNVMMATANGNVSWSKTFEIAALAQRHGILNAERKKLEKFHEVPLGRWQLAAKIAWAIGLVATRNEFIPLAERVHYQPFLHNIVTNADFSRAQQFLQANKRIQFLEALIRVEAPNTDLDHFMGALYRRNTAEFRNDYSYDVDNIANNRLHKALYKSATSPRLLSYFHGNGLIDFPYDGNGDFGMTLRDDNGDIFYSRQSALVVWQYMRMRHIPFDGSDDLLDFFTYVQKAGWNTDKSEPVVSIQRDFDAALEFLLRNGLSRPEINDIDVTLAPNADNSSFPHAKWLMFVLWRFVASERTWALFAEVLDARPGPHFMEAAVRTVQPAAVVFARQHGVPLPSHLELWKIFNSMRNDRDEIVIHCNHGVDLDMFFHREHEDPGSAGNHIADAALVSQLVAYIVQITGNNPLEPPDPLIPALLDANDPLAAVQRVINSGVACLRTSAATLALQEVWDVHMKRGQFARERAEIALLLQAHFDYNPNMYGEGKRRKRE